MVRCCEPAPATVLTITYAEVQPMWYSTYIVLCVAKERIEVAHCYAELSCIQIIDYTRRNEYQ